MKKILFIVNGQGLGNCTRCHAIIRELFGDKIDVLTSGNGLEYFKNVPEVSHIYSQKQLRYKSQNGRINIALTLLNFPTYISHLFQNASHLSKLIALHKYDVIVSDSDYTIMAIGHRPPVIAVNNSQMVLETLQRENKFSPFSLSVLMERLDYLFHRIFPDAVLSLGMSRLSGPRKFHFVPLISRQSKFSEQSNSDSSVLVIPGGSSFSNANDLLKNIRWPSTIRKITVPEGTSLTGNFEIKYYSRSEGLQDLIPAHDFLITQGGLSSVSEAVIHKKPAVVVPLENHPEQYANARAFEIHGLGLLATSATITKKIEELIHNFPTYQQSHAKFHLPNGAAVAAKIIRDLAGES